ncbi:MAG: TIGR01777 family oxidoreductase [Deltaproteobacteria bacterium]|nr:TIGR01777 family oxidoreductase [Myxococcales bacterium]MDP3215720.1 TIGR01777 family oxidoreductase [Deltaproteobacteria bacterium]
MRVGVVGATGFVGRSLVAALIARGDEVVAFSRDPVRARRSLPAGADARSLEAITPEGVADLDAVVNLAGEPVGAKRWDDAFRAAIRESRVRTTRRVVDAIAGASPRPRVLVNASAVGFYGPRGDEEVTEATPPGDDFLAGVCRDWEREAERAGELGAREVRLRIGVVLGDGGGSLERMLLPFKLFVGGPVGDGRQWFPWVHLADVVGATLWAIDHDDLRGPVNVTAPEPVRFRDFAEALGRQLHRPSWLPVPAFALRLALGPMAEVVVTGQRAVPAALLASGYAFKHPRVAGALAAAV